MSVPKTCVLCGLWLLMLGGCRNAPQPVPVAAPVLQRARHQPIPKRLRGAMQARPKSPIRINQSRPRAQIVYSVRTQHQVFALTFDDGPDPAYTPQILQILRERRVPATFFMVGQMVRAHPEDARRVRDDKHAIGNHSWSHAGAPRDPLAEVERTDAQLQTTCGAVAVGFRPPYGLMENGMVAAARKRDQDVILWSVVGADWDASASSASISGKIIRGASPGGIALLHDGGGNRGATVAALPRIIDALRERGYRFVTVPELLTLGPVVSSAPAVARRAARKRVVRH